MLLLVTTPAKKRQFQNQLEEILTSTLKPKGSLKIGYRGPNFEHDVFTLGRDKLWASFILLKQERSTTRFWNGFGIFQPDHPTQTIAVEINIPLESNSERVAGFFAEDPLTGAIYLMHSGKIGGGRKGIGKSAFLAWSKSELVDVATGYGETRSGLIIGNIHGTDLADRIWRFVQLVAAFKDAAVSGDLDGAEFQSKVSAFEQYRKEFSGRKHGKRTVGDIDYISYHGDVVQALHDERSAKLGNGETIGNNILMDLFVSKDGKLIELYEIKTNTDRQTLYTAIGQLITHSAGIALRRFIVVPDRERVPDDFIAALREHKIALRRFKVTGQKIKKVFLLPP